MSIRLALGSESLDRGGQGPRLGARYRAPGMAWSPPPRCPSRPSTGPVSISLGPSSPNPAGVIGAADLVLLTVPDDVLPGLVEGLAATEAPLGGR